MATLACESITDHVKIVQTTRDARIVEGRGIHACLKIWGVFFIVINFVAGRSHASVP